ncbi:MAG: Hpt domain-containing protein [Cyanobacteria bacterium J06643_4]
MLINKADRELFDEDVAMLTSHIAGPIEFDWQQLRQLAGEDAGFEAELLTIFLQDTENSLRELEGAIAAQNAETVEQVAHSLRGSSANVGASALAAVAFQLEQMARRGDLSSANMLLQKLNQQCRSIRAYFQTMR